ncbi:MAG TPA: amino acid permease [Brevundimonas diminuta]|nr:amino acid permease [Brevundimonas diminuta]
MAFWNRRRSIDAMLAPHSGPGLKKTLGWPHLMALGVGAIVGTGILTLIGVGAGLAGPAVLISFALAGLVCACAALAYAELSTIMPASGSAYTYSYAALGEIFAWVVGWSLILEYSLVVSTVAVGWSGYAVPFLAGLGVDLPFALTVGPHVEGGLINLPAIFIIAIVTGLLLLGTKESATLNAILVFVKIAALVVFVAIAMPHFDTANFTPFMPHGFGAPFVQTGVMAAAAIIFFAFYGFDAIATAAEETRNPKRDLAIGIIGSMLVCAAIYTVIATAALGAAPFTLFANSPEPLALILREIGQPGVAHFLAVTAVLTLPTVILAFFYGQSRIFFVMARDGLLPRGLSQLSAKGAPLRITAFTTAVVGTIALFFPLGEIVALANAGTLVAFSSVALCMLILRRRSPELPRGFRTPLAWVIGPVAIAGCLYLLASLPQKTQLWFLIWNVIGVGAYLLYGRRFSVARREAREAEQAAAD